MLFRCAAYLLVCFCLFFSVADAQQKLHGKIYNEKGDELLVAVTVRNISNRQFEVSDLGGNYMIKAKEGDTLVFSSSNYFPDTVFVSFFMLNAGKDVSMQPKEKVLAPVTVRNLNAYQVDSIDRHDYYESYYNDPNRTVVNKNGPPNALGITISPITYFSTEEKQKRKLRERLSYDEQQYYIDYKFSEVEIINLTHLQGDSLKQFMERFRPSYKFCRKSTPESMQQYILDSQKQFMKKED